MYLVTMWCGDKWLFFKLPHDLFMLKTTQLKQLKVSLTQRIVAIKLILRIF